MRKCWSFLGSFFFSVICFVLPDHTLAARHALVIGNDSYKHLSELKKARADANSIERALKSNGYSVTKKLDLTDAQMRKQVREFLRTLNKGDEVIFFYAGHGVQINNSNFLLGTDIQGVDEKEVQDEALPLQQILKDFSTKQLKFTLAIIDACRDNPFQALGRNVGSRGLAPTNPVTGQMIIYSAGADQQALDRLGENDPNPNSVFTRALLQEFDKGRRSIREILLDVRRTVVAQANRVKRQQVPAIYDQMIDDIYIGSGSPSATAVSEVTVASGPSQSTAMPLIPAKISNKEDSEVFEDCAGCPPMVVIPAGRFRMGDLSGPGSSVSVSSQPVRWVSVDRFAMGEHEVTFAQWDMCVAEGGCRYVPSDEGWGRADRPVMNVSFNDVTSEFIPWLNKKTGNIYRLPSEAEWEYAARAGTDSNFYWGDKSSIGDNMANCKYCSGRSSKHTVAVKSYKPNDWGLYDIHGNLWELTQDCWNSDYEGAPNNQVARLSGSCDSRMVRGGSWNSEVWLMEVHKRSNSPTNERSNYVGFRLARVL